MQLASQGEASKDEPGSRGPSFEARKSAHLRMTSECVVSNRNPDRVSASHRIRPVQRIHRDGAPRARDAGADFCVLVLLVVAEEDVAIVDLAVDGDDVDGAEAAALAARCRRPANVFLLPKAAPVVLGGVAPTSD